MSETAPISFYGQVTEPSGKPLANVRIRLRVVKPNWTFILGAERRFFDQHYELSTDSDGRFQLTNESGRTLHIDHFEFPGYRFKLPNVWGPWGTTFEFAGGGANPTHVPDPNKPVVFVMERAD